LAADTADEMDENIDEKRLIDLVLICFIRG